MKGTAEMWLELASRTRPSQSRQLVGTRAGGAGKTLVCAHMDSVYGTPAALDNGTGTAMLLQAATMSMQAAALCAGQLSGRGLEFVPFNSEEYFAYTAQLRYLQWQAGQAEPVRLVINIDAPCHLGSKIAVASYGLAAGAEATLDALIERHPSVARGEPWYAGDHVPFLQQGIPCISLASSDFAEGGLNDTHTPRDTPATVDAGQIDAGAAFLAELLAALP